MPKRYGKTNKVKFSSLEKKYGQKLIIKRFDIPYFGKSPSMSTLSYIFYFLKVIPFVILIYYFLVKCKIINGIFWSDSRFFTKSKLFIDYRDTFSDNFYYLYRWKRKFYFIDNLALEKFVFESAHSITLFLQVLKKYISI